MANSISSTDLDHLFSVSRCRTVNPEDLTASYVTLIHSEVFCTQEFFSTHLQAAKKWLRLYNATPRSAISTSKDSAYGKMTRALFRSLEIKMPRTKEAMIEALKMPPGLRLEAGQSFRWLREAASSRCFDRSEIQITQPLPLAA